MLTEQEKPVRLRCWLETPPCLREMRSWTLTGGYNSYQTSHMRMVTGIGENRQFITTKFVFVGSWSNWNLELMVLDYLVPVRGFLRPSRSMHFGDVSKTNGRDTNGRSDHVTRNASAARNNVSYPTPEQIEQRKEAATSSTQIWCGLWDSSPGRIGGRSHPCNPMIVTFSSRLHPR